MALNFDLFNIAGLLGINLPNNNGGPSIGTPGFNPFGGYSPYPNLPNPEPQQKPPEPSDIAEGIAGVLFPTIVPFLGAGASAAAGAASDIANGANPLDPNTYIGPVKEAVTNYVTYAGLFILLLFFIVLTFFGSQVKETIVEGSKTAAKAALVA